MLLLDRHVAVACLCCRRTGPDSCVTLRDMPWSPRWPVDEMGARLFNFLKQEAASFLAKDLLS